VIWKVPVALPITVLAPEPEARVVLPVEVSVVNVPAAAGCCTNCCGINTS
jgi:hypothetical protein